jgi:hypothetical protein
LLHDNFGVANSLAVLLQHIQNCAADDNDDEGGVSRRLL